MKAKQNIFAQRVATKSEVKMDKKWKASKKPAIAGCSGPDARGNSRWGGRDNGIWC
ncbi:hypothetical protein OE749_13360 [Aestuariibacter sp. AA17]|uniref:Uncharacterized protein n=1 Tax=Fluctibacter corallii TaxID=2984329 RepID=A0ABT3AAR9_9ALTE|nr:hypothetical protein [Aestuariibacter sp. AA17]MCV2885680.1 hypothetical protein [Aestuariibacter sp. AA17]